MLIYRLNFRDNGFCEWRPSAMSAENDFRKAVEYILETNNSVVIEDGTSTVEYVIDNPNDSLLE